MLQSTGVTPPLVFAGGVARNPCMAALVGREYELLIPQEPDLVGALGAALHAARTTP
jgi:activator of 2-hydroxyglutaryl-CoA dehydratase